MELIAGQSGKNRITFFTHEKNVTAIRKENGEIEFEHNTTKEYNAKKKEKKEKSKGIAIPLWTFLLASILKAYLVMPLIEKQVIGVGWYLVVAFYYLFVTIISIFMLREEIGEEGLRNHGAEHKVFTAYQKLKRIPSMQEAKQFSRICKCCGATIYSAFITAQLIGFAIYLYNGWRISELVLFIVPILFYSFCPFNLLGKFAQFFTTMEPRDSNIELAISALSELEKREMKSDVLEKYVRDALTKYQKGSTN